MQPLTWEQIRPWKTAFTTSRRFGAACDTLLADGLPVGAILQAVLLRVYDIGSSEEASLGPDLVFREIHDFGSKGLAALPAHGATTTPPTWGGITSTEQENGEAYDALFAVCEDLRKDKVSHHEISEGLLLRAGELLKTCEEASARYWYRQFEELGARGYETARSILSGANPRS